MNINNPNLTWSYFKDKESCLKEIDSIILKLKQKNPSAIKDLESLFMPTCTFQDLSLDNGWGEDFLKLAEQFDNIKSDYFS